MCAMNIALLAGSSTLQAFENSSLEIAQLSGVCTSYVQDHLSAKSRSFAYIQEMTVVPVLSLSSNSTENP